MLLKLDRKYKKSTYTIGILYVNGKYFSETIEDADRGLNNKMPEALIKLSKVYGKTAIPTGKYKINMNTVSPKFCNRDWAKPYQGKVPRLEKVLAFSGILIHPFNTAEDSYGCIAVGQNKVKGKVVNSTVYFKKLMDEYLIPAKDRNEEIFIEIV